MFRRTTLVAWLLVVAEWEHASSLMRLPFVKTTPQQRRLGRGGYLPTVAKPLLLDSTAVFGILPSSNPEEWQLLFQSFQDKLVGSPLSPTQLDPLSALTGSLISQTQTVLQDGIQQASASYLKVQDELTTVASTLQTGLQEQLSTLETIPTLTQEQLSTLTESVHGQVLELTSIVEDQVFTVATTVESQVSTFATTAADQVSSLTSTVEGQVSSLATTVEGQVSLLSTTVAEVSSSAQSNLVAQWGALTLLWSALQSSLTVNVDIQMTTLQTELVEQLTGLALVVKNAEASTAALWQEQASTLFQLMTSLQEQVAGWTEHQQQALMKWLSTFGNGLDNTDWSADLVKWQEQLSNANQVVKTAVTGMGLLLGAYFVFGPQQSDEETSRSKKAVTTQVAMEKSKLDSVLQQVSMVEKEHEELEQAILKASPPLTTATMDKPFFMEDKPTASVLETMSIVPPPTDLTVIQTYYSSTANYLGSSTIAKGEAFVKDDVAAVLNVETAATDLAICSVETAPAIAMEQEVPVATSIVVTEMVAAPVVEAEVVAPMLEPAALPAVEVALRVSPTVSYLESLSSTLPDKAALPSSQSYLDSLSKPPRMLNRSYLDTLSKVSRPLSTTYLDSLANVRRPKTSEFETAAVALSEKVTTDVVVDSSKEEVLEILTENSLTYPINADGAKDWPLEVSAQVPEPVISTLTTADTNAEDWPLGVSAFAVSELTLPTTEAFVEEKVAVDDLSMDLVADGADASAALDSDADVESTAAEDAVDVLLPSSEVTEDANTMMPVTEASEDKDWAALSNEIIPDIWNKVDPADDAMEEMVTVAPSLADAPADCGNDRDWAGLSDEIKSDIWNKEAGQGDSNVSDALLPVTGSGEPWLGVPEDKVVGDLSTEAKPRVPLTALLSDEDNEIREYIKVKAAQKTRERLQEQVVRRNGAEIGEPGEIVMVSAPRAKTWMEEASMVSEPEDIIVKEPYVEVAKSIVAREETITMRIVKNNLDEASSVEVAPRRLQRTNQSKPKLSKKRLLTAVAVLAVVVGQRALTAILNRSLL